MFTWVLDESRANEDVKVAKNFEGLRNDSAAAVRSAQRSKVQEEKAKFARLVSDVCLAERTTC